MAAATAAQLEWISVLADPTRARLLRLLEQQELTVAELCSVVQLPQSTVSRHLKTLGDHGWIGWRPEGTSRLYRMNGTTQSKFGGRLWSVLRDVTDKLPKVGEDDKRLANVLDTRRTRSQAFFSSAAGQWDSLRDELYGPRFDLLALPALLDATWTVGDLGCGTAQLSSVLAPFVDRVVAVDDSSVMLRQARKRLKKFSNIDLRRGNLTALPLEDEELDAAITCMVLHHLPEPPQMLHEAARVLKRHAKLLLIDILKHDREDYQQQMGHIWLGFEPDQIRQWGSEAGFHQTIVYALPIDSQAKGPATFAATFVK